MIAPLARAVSRLFSGSATRGVCIICQPTVWPPWRRGGGGVTVILLHCDMTVSSPTATGPRPSAGLTPGAGSRRAGPRPGLGPLGDDALPDPRPRTVLGLGRLPAERLAKALPAITCTASRVRTSTVAAPPDPRPRAVAAGGRSESGRASPSAATDPRPCTAGAGGPASAAAVCPSLAATPATEFEPRACPPIRSLEFEPIRSLEFYQDRPRARCARPLILRPSRRSGLADARLQGRVSLQSRRCPIARPGVAPVSPMPDCKAGCRASSHGATLCSRPLHSRRQRASSSPPARPPGRRRSRRNPSIPVAGFWNPANCGAVAGVRAATPRGLGQPPSRVGRPVAASESARAAPGLGTNPAGVGVGTPAPAGQAAARAQPSACADAARARARAAHIATNFVDSIEPCR